MEGRRFESPRAEAAAVRKALIEEELCFKEVRPARKVVSDCIVVIIPDVPYHIRHQRGSLQGYKCVPNCPACRIFKKLPKQIGAVIERVTGRGPREYIIA